MSCPMDLVFLYSLFLLELMCMWATELQFDSSWCLVGTVSKACNKKEKKHDQFSYVHF